MDVSPTSSHPNHARTRRIGNYRYTEFHLPGRSGRHFRSLLGHSAGGRLRSRRSEDPYSDYDSEYAYRIALLNSSTRSRHNRESTCQEPIPPQSSGSPAVSRLPGRRRCRPAPPSVPRQTGNGGEWPNRGAETRPRSSKSLDLLPFPEAFPKSIPPIRRDRQIDPTAFL
jgi:hypothetical protein